VISEENEGITLIIKAKDLAELKEKLISQVTEFGIEIPEEETEEEVEIDFPDEIKEIYPDYEYNQHSAAMLTVLREEHRGRTNRVSSWDLANEMKERFPEYFYRVPPRKISWGNIFAANQLEERGLIHIDRDEKGRRLYSVD